MRDRSPNLGKNFGMSRIILTGAVLLVLGQAALAAGPEQKPARHTDQAPVLQQPGSGTKVDEVVPDSAAAKAGVRPGDVVVGIDGKPINTYLDIAPIVALSGGRPLVIDIDRGGSRVRVKATPIRSNEPTAPGSAPQWLLGITHLDSEQAPPPWSVWREVSTSIDSAKQSTKQSTKESDKGSDKVGSVMAPASPEQPRWSVWRALTGQ
jgi:membrane-associated protease RseP (regulator of RpoE activity)